VVLVLDKGVIMLAAKASSKLKMLPGVEGWAPVMMEGFGGEHAEGSHVGVATIAIKEDGLDLFLRFILAHLMHFRARVGHPGFWLKAGQPQMMVTYLTSITHEKDPVLRAEKLRQYEDEVRAGFAGNPVPPQDGSVKESPSASEAPGVIHLPPPSDSSA